MGAGAGLVYGDLLPGNLLFERGRLSAVIDFWGLGVGDPACDLMIAWGLFSGESRDVFRAHWRSMMLRGREVEVGRQLRRCRSSRERFMKFYQPLTDISTSVGGRPGRFLVHVRRKSGRDLDRTAYGQVWMSGMAHRRANKRRDGFAKPFVDTVHAVRGLP